MPKRVIDFDAMWASDKIAACATWAQAEYAWLYGLADCNGCFELSNLRVIWGRVAAIRRNLSLELLEQIFDEFHRQGLLFVWRANGKRYGHWVGSDVPGRLPPPSWRNCLERLAPPVPQRELERYIAAWKQARGPQEEAAGGENDGVGRTDARRSHIFFGADNAPQNDRREALRAPRDDKRGGECTTREEKRGEPDASWNNKPGAHARPGVILSGERSSLAAKNLCDEFTVDEERASPADASKPALSELKPGLEPTPAEDLDLGLDLDLEKEKKEKIHTQDSNAGERNVERRVCEDASRSEIYKGEGNGTSDGPGVRRSGAEILRRSPLRPISAQDLARSAEIGLLAPQNDKQNQAEGENCAVPADREQRPRPYEAGQATTPQMLAEIWEQERGALPALRAMTSERMARCRARLAHARDARTFLGEFREAVRRAAATPFLCGAGPAGWRANFDWFIANGTNYLKVLEGRYETGMAAAQGARPANADAAARNARDVAVQRELDAGRAPELAPGTSRMRAEVIERWRRRNVG
jgi:hypothetical protein